MLTNFCSATWKVTSLLRPTLLACNGSAQKFHTTQPNEKLRTLSRLRVIDNSAIGKAAMTEGRPPKIIHIYTKRKFGITGDKVLVAIKGEKKKGIVVGCVKEQPYLQPSFDTNNVVLVNDDGSPLGTRILLPIPSHLRTKLKNMSRPKGADYTKLMSIATRYV